MYLPLLLLSQSLNHHLSKLTKPKWQLSNVAGAEVKLQIAVEAPGEAAEPTEAASLISPTLPTLPLLQGQVTQNLTSEVPDMLTDHQTRPVPVTGPKAGQRLTAQIH